MPVKTKGKKARKVKIPSIAIEREWGKEDPQVTIMEVSSEQDKYITFEKHTRRRQLTSMIIFDFDVDQVEAEQGKITRICASPDPFEDFAKESPDVYENLCRKAMEWVGDYLAAHHKGLNVRGAVVTFPETIYREYDLQTGDKGKIE